MTELHFHAHSSKIRQSVTDSQKKKKRKIVKSVTTTLQLPYVQKLIENSSRESS